MLRSQEKEEEEEEVPVTSDVYESILALIARFYSLSILGLRFFVRDDCVSLE